MENTVKPLFGWRRALGGRSFGLPNYRRTLTGYGFALICVLAVILIRLGLGTFDGGSTHLILAVPAVVLAGTLAGLGPGVFASLAAGLAFELLFARAEFTQPPFGPEHVHFSIYLLASLSVLWATVKLRRAAASAEKTEARLQEVLRQVPAAVAILEAPDGRLLLRSRLSDAILGHGSLEVRSTADLDAYHGIHPDGRGYRPDEYPIARALTAGEIVTGEVMRYRRPDGYVTDLEVHAGPVRGSDGEIIAAVGMAFDISERAAAERRLRESELRHRELSERLNAALDAGALGTWQTDLETGKTQWDATMAAMLGLPAGPVVLDNTQSESFFDPAERARAMEAFDRAVREDAPYVAELRRRMPNGELRWFVTRGGVLKDMNKVVGVIQDVTDHRTREADLRELADTRALLMREADHRIKNSLQLVVSLLGLQSGRMENGEAKESLEAAIGRIEAVAAGHLALQISADFTTIDAASMLEGLCERLGKLNPAAPIDCLCAGPALLEASIAIPLELILSEILTNALRHAFPPGAPGSIKVDLACDGERLAIEIADDGVGLPDPPSSEGLGTTIINALAAQIGAEVATRSAPGRGASFTVSVPKGCSTGSTPPR